MEPRGIGEVGTVVRVERCEPGTVLLPRPEHPTLPVIIGLIRKAALPEQLSILPVAEALRQPAQRRVGDIIFEGMRDRVVTRHILREPSHRDISPGDIRVDVGAHPVVLTRGRGRLAERLVGGIDVEAAQAFEPCVRDDGNGGVALHGPRLTPEEFPFGHPAPLTVHVDHRAHHLHLPVGIEQRLELMEVAVGVPEGEHGVARAGGASDAVALHHRIFAIDILQDTRFELGMVERRIEDALLCFRPSFNSDGAERLFPFAVRLSRYVLKGLAALLRLKVLTRVPDGHKRHTDTHLHSRAVGKVVVEETSDTVAGQVASVMGIELVFTVVGIPLALCPTRLGLQLPETGRQRLLVDPYDEIHGEDRLGIVAKSAEKPETLYLGVADTPHTASDLIRQTVTDIYQDMALALGEGVTLP